MIIDDDRVILFVEPQLAASKEPVRDELSAKMREAMRRARQSDYAAAGVHFCTCGAASDNVDWILPTGHITNSLAVHYLEFHRDEIPQKELEKVRKL